MMKKCKKCQHIYDEAHECPTPEYEAARDALIAEAALAIELFDEDFLDE